VNILDKAIVFATERHSGSVRKGTDIPFIVHPLEAVSIAAGITNDIEVLAAAVLHDVVEDTPTQLPEIEAAFGKRVAELVASESEDKMTDIPPSESWKLRKEATITALQTASYDEKTLVLADKLSNIRAINRDYTLIGEKLWERFNQKDKKMHGWYYRSVAEALSDLSDTTAYNEFCRLVESTFK
jgi:myo-inositol-1(or 4)-monophosphatase